MVDVRVYGGCEGVSLCMCVVTVDVVPAGYVYDYERLMALCVMLEVLWYVSWVWSTHLPVWPISSYISDSMIFVITEVFAIYM